MKGKELKNYHGHIDLSVHNNSHTQAFLFLQEHCAEYGISKPRVLEVGCSGGYFSEALQDHGVYVHAIEPFSTEAKDAGRVDEFFHGTVEDFCAADHADLHQSFDAVIMGDILEHLLDPRQALIDLSVFLKDEGVFIASVPNATHVGIQRMLEDRQWTYQKYGILDSTHLRFFCWHSLRNMFIESGFGVERRYDVLVSEFKVYPSMSSVNEVILEKDLEKGKHTFQFVVRASRKALAQEAYSDSYPHNILLISPNPESSLTALRLIRPLAEYLSHVGGGLKAVTTASVENLRWADVVIAHREISIYTLELLRLARKMEVPVIYDTDDLLTQLPSWSLSKCFPNDKTLMENTLATADRVTCTTQPLKDELLKFADKVHIVPNVLVSKDIPNPIERQYSDDCTLVIASSDAVLVDFLLMPIRTLCKVVPSLKVVTIGNVGRFFNGITPNLTQYEQCSEQDFTLILNGIDNGIGLIPLDDSLFSSCKSSIKYFHYTSCGIVSVASSVPPYTECIENGRNGLLAENLLEGWCGPVMQLIKNHKYRQSLLSHAIRTWEEHGSSKVAVEGWKKAFELLPKPGEKTALKRRESMSEESRRP